MGLPVGLLAAALRPAWREGLPERLGLRAPRADGPDPHWVHAASVGEVQAALRLIDRLTGRGDALVASTTTLTGRALARRTRPGLATALAPLDHPWCVAAALSRCAPRSLVLVETELWPSWIAGAERRQVPVLVVSGRISDRSFPRYRRLSRWLEPTLRRLSAVGARSQRDAERFVALGVPERNVVVTGDLKLEPPAAPPELAPDLGAALARVPYWVAGSTHPGEEVAAWEATRALRREGARLALVVAPRHPERIEAAAQALEAAGAKLTRRSASALPVLGDGEVLLLDTLGELAAVYSGARAAFVGGTLVPVGGHNLLEPLQAGVPVLFGPHTSNARDGAELLLATGAGARVDGEASLAAALGALLEDDAERHAGIARGRLALEDHRGAAERSAALLDRVLAGGGVAP
ncbi:MAG: glycosyltransferase N-terminal domain-containing protein [Planctomycetota bacterium]|nr:glycosyltransferase N-terminal domain-containing protein [Planctomycetota bacterium]